MKKVETVQSSSKTIRIGMYQPERFVNANLKSGPVTRRKGGFAIEFEVIPHHTFDITKSTDAIYRQFLHKFYKVMRIQMKTGSKIIQLSEPILFTLESSGKSMDLGDALLRLKLNMKWGKKSVQQNRFNITVKELIKISMGSLDQWATDDMLNDAIGAVSHLALAEQIVRDAAKELKAATIAI